MEEVMKPNQNGQKTGLKGRVKSLNKERNNPKNFPKTFPPRKSKENLPNWGPTLLPWEMEEWLTKNKEGKN